MTVTQSEFDETICVNLILVDGEADTLGQKHPPRGSNEIDTGEMWQNLVESGCWMLGLSRSARLRLPSSAGLVVEIV